MADQEHLEMLKRGVQIWNQWRADHPDILPDLSNAHLRYESLEGANLRGAILYRADFSETRFFESDLSKAILIQAILTETRFFESDLSKADLTGADISGADLSKANLSGTRLVEANFRGANIRRANLSDADLRRANLSDADLTAANLSHVNLSGATLVRTNFTLATLTNSNIYGIAAWNVALEGASQYNLVITPEDEPTITVDNLKIAQFIYLLLNNKEIREVIDTITSKVVLILGRFTPERKAVLDALRDELRRQNYLPVLFDFEKPASRDITETVSTLAHMARFVIADITDARSIPQELMLIVPNLPSVPVQPLILNSQHEYGMFEHFTRYPWVLPLYLYQDQTSLLSSLNENIIEPAEQKAQELEKR